MRYNRTCTNCRIRQQSATPLSDYDYDAMANTDDAAAYPEAKYKAAQYYDPPRKFRALLCN